MQVKDETDDKDAVQDGSNMQVKDETDDKDADQFSLEGSIVSVNWLETIKVSG